MDPRNFPLINPDGPSNGPRRDSFAELCAAFELDPSAWPRVATGGGGTHYYLQKPEDIRIVDTLRDFPGVEFKSKGRQVLAAGSVHPNGRLYVLDDINEHIGNPPLAPAALIDAIRRPAPTGLGRAGELTPEQMARWLCQLDPADFRDEGRWRDLMMSCHFATAGEGRQEFIDWSTADPSYADHDKIIGRRWDSLHADRPASITEKTLYKCVYEAGGGEPIAPAEGDFEPWEGDSEPQADIPPELAALCRQWRWVADADAFFNSDDGRSYNRSQFEGRYCHLVSSKSTIVRQALKGVIPMLKLDSLSYRPGMGELPGDGTLNLWRPSGILPKPGDVSWFLEHMEYLVPDDRERGILLDFLAHLVQKPGEKVNFAPLVQGGQGTGKSAVGVLMERILGENIWPGTVGRHKSLKTTLLARV